MASYARRFVWSEEQKLVFLRILANWKARYGASKPYSWPEIISEFNKRTGEIVHKGVLLNKLDGMKTEYSHWKNLLKSETGAVVDPSTGFVSAEPSWWARKLKESKGYRRFIRAGIPKAVEDLYSQIFDGSAATSTPDASRPGPNANVQPKGASVPEDGQTSRVLGSAAPSMKRKRDDSGQEEADDDDSDSDDRRLRK